MKLAEQAAEEGHRVTLLERAGRLGGQLLAAAELPGRRNWMDLVEDLTGSIERLDVDVRLGTEGTAAVVASLDPEGVFLATGSRYDLSGYSIATPGRDRVPGVERDGVIDPITAISDPEACGERVVIVDDNGDHVPLSLARMLAESGRTVAVVSSGLFAGSGLVVTGDLPWLLPKLTETGVRVVSQATVDRMGPGAVTVSSVWGGDPIELPADTVVPSMLRVAEDSLEAELDGLDAPVVKLGDCLAPREVDDATFEAVGLARAIGSAEVEG
jgi:NADPH-dependent 2,4-dienoyl-CoA reductase/sulfur reductase-like enzyme